MTTATLLVELFTEELPPKSLRKLGESFCKSIFESIRAQGLASDDSKATVFASPRRLAASITGVNTVGGDKRVRQKLMPTKVAFTADGKPSPALIKRLEKEGYASGEMPEADLTRVVEGGAEYLYLDQVIAGQTLPLALLNAVKSAIAELPVAKVMRYQLADGETTVQFVRPAHGLIALHGAEVVPLHVLGLDAGRVAHGHRFQGAANIELKHADEYEARLESEGGVIASFEKRRDEIKRLLFAHAEQTGDTLGEPEDYAALLDEVTALVERPTVYVGKFDAEFLEVPAECLVLTMKLNQKYFPLFLSEGGLSSRFLIVSNMRLDDPRNVIEGNERVVRPRLSDARFFFETDKKTKLVDRIPKLASVVYHNKLGSQGERIERVCKLASHIAVLIGADVAQADRGARLAKADLVTDMVGEFPELQGIMGRYYALHDSESSVVADAIQQHYWPRFAGDKLPDSRVALSVALADKLETLVGLFGVGQLPTGDKDPFALRRHALGVIRMIVEKQLPIDLGELLKFAHGVFPAEMLKDTHETQEVEIPNWRKVKIFVDERAKGYLRDCGYAFNEVNAVVDLGVAPHEYLGRLIAVRSFLLLPEAQELSTSDKRIRNILQKSGALSVVENVDERWLNEESEKSLFGAVRSLRPQVDALIAASDFSNAIQLVAQISPRVSEFFRTVMVNVDDEAIRNNRFRLLHEVSNLTSRVADLSKLAA
jgi:glycyl-tRNA synthetase beta chain